MRAPIVVTLLLVLVGPACAEQAEMARFKTVAERLVKAVNAGDVKAFRQDFARSMLEFLPAEKAQVFIEGLTSQLGQIDRLEAARLYPPNQCVYVVRFQRGLLDMKIWLDQEDRIIGLLFTPHVPDIPAPEKHETELTLPFKGRWKVIWGGDTKELNLHHDAQNQRFAFDFLMVDEEGNSHGGQGRANRDYYAFGKDVLAPADGMVTDVIDGVRENVPGSMNPYSALGNAVFIQHREHEVSVLAHLKLGSIRVKVGDRIKEGQVIGLCGNSGNSSEPHLHYHLQNTPVIQDGTGIKCHFRTVVVTRDGKAEPRQNYSPIRGDVVASE